MVTWPPVQTLCTDYQCFVFHFISRDSKAKDNKEEVVKFEAKQAEPVSMMEEMNTKQFAAHDVPVEKMTGDLPYVKSSLGLKEVTKETTSSSGMMTNISGNVDSKSPEAKKGEEQIQEAVSLNSVSSSESGECNDLSLSFKEESEERYLPDRNVQDCSELEIKCEGESPNETSQSLTENFGNEPVHPMLLKEEEANVDYPRDRMGDKTEILKEDPPGNSLETKDEKTCGMLDVCDSGSPEMHVKQFSESKVPAATPKTEVDTCDAHLKPSDSSHKIKISKGPKIKRTLSRAERLSRMHSSRGGSSSKMNPSRIVSSTKTGSSFGISSLLKVGGPSKTDVKSDKTAQRRRGSRGSRSSSISPRGYGYSMAFMDIEKPNLSSTMGVDDVETHALNNEPPVTESCVAGTPPNHAASGSSETQTTPKPQTYQAKKFRLDQITGKLSAQRQSEAQAAAHSPSAFQLTGHHSSPPPDLSPSPTANPPYPLEAFPPPPPLIYSPMPTSCCPTPHCQHMYGPHPAHSMHLSAGHLHPHPDYPPGSSGYMMYPHGVHYPPPGHCLGQCKFV